MAAAETARMLAAMDLDDRKFQAGIRRSLGGLSKLDKGIGSTARGVGRVGKGFGKAAGVVGAAAVGGLVFAGKAAIDFQDAFQGVVKTVDASPAKFDEIAASIRNMSLEMPVAATDLARIAEAGGAMGVKANDIEAFTKQVATLASTTNVSADDAATALGQLQNVIGLTGNEFDNFAATLVDLGNKGSSTESQILEITRRSGSAARLLGLAKSATVGWAAAAANLGLNQELAGTALQNFYVKTLQLVSKGGKGLTGFAKIAGVSATKLKKMFSKDASGALDAFIKGLSKLPKDKRLEAVNQFFGKGSGMTRLILGLAGTIDKNLNPALRDSAKAWFESTAAQKEFDKRNSTVRSAIIRLKNGIVDAAVSIGEGFTPAIGRASDKLAAFLKDPANRTQLKAIGEDIGKAIDSIDWDKVLGVAKSLGSAFKPALDVLVKLAGLIASLPPGVIGAGGALVLTDRLSGGAVSSGIGGIIGGLGSSLVKSLAAQIPIFGKAFVQPVFVTNPGFGGLPGSVPGAAGEALGGAAKVGGTAGAGIVITDMHAFNQDLADRLRTGQNSDSPFAQTAAAAFGAQAAKETPWDKILEGLGLKEASENLDAAAASLITTTGRDIDKNLPSSANVLQNLGDLGINLGRIANGQKELPSLKRQLADVTRFQANAQKRGDAKAVQLWGAIGKSLKADIATIHGHPPKEKSDGNVVTNAIHDLKNRLTLTIERQTRAEHDGRTRTARLLAAKEEEIRAAIRRLEAPHRKNPTGPTPRDMDKNLPGAKSVLADLKSNGINLGSIAQHRLDSLHDEQSRTRAAFEGSSKALGTGIGNVNSTAKSGLASVASTARAGLDNATSATRSGTSGTTAATNVGASRIVGAIASNRPIVNVSSNTVVSVTASGVQKSTTTSTRYGEQNGSAGGGTAGGSQTKKYD